MGKDEIAQLQFFEQKQTEKNSNKEPRWPGMSIMASSSVVAEEGCSLHSASTNNNNNNMVQAQQSKLHQQQDSNNSTLQQGISPTPTVTSYPSSATTTSSPPRTASASSSPTRVKMYVLCFWSLFYLYLCFYYIYVLLFPRAMAAMRPIQFSCQDLRMKTLHLLWLNHCTRHRKK